MEYSPRIRSWNGRNCIIMAHGRQKPDMAFLTLIARGFIDFFGITQPTAEQQRRAAWFVCALLALILICAGLVFALIVQGFGR